jgi:hypothetical protein
LVSCDDSVGPPWAPFVDRPRKIIKSEGKRPDGETDREKQIENLFF